MNDGDNSILNLPFHVKTIPFLMIGIILTGILFVFTLVINHNHTAMARQQQPNGIPLDALHPGPTISKLISPSSPD